MGKSDWECYTGCDRISTTGLYYDFRVYCYWKSNGWRYNMGPVRGYACMDTEELVYNDSIDFQDNQGTYLLGYHDFRVNRGHSSIQKEYYAYIVSEASYESGTRESTPGEHLYCYTDAKTHTVITYNANGGSGQPGNQDKWYGESLYLSNTKPTRTGYTFKNWNTASNGSGTSYNPGSQYGPDPGGTVTLYAQWTPITYAVTYNGNGSNATSVPSSQTKTYGQNLTLSSQTPIRADYIFNGWNTKADGTGTNYAAGATYTGNAALTLYAKWTLAYVKPRYDKLSINRCNSSGTKSETGTYLRVDFTWTSDLTGVYAKLQYREISATQWTTVSIFDNNNNKSGTVSNKVIGSNNFSIEKSYIARIYIYDSKGTSYATYSGEYAISTVAFPIDVRKQGKGVAFGKVAEKDNLLDSAWTFNAPNVRSVLESHLDRSSSTDANIPHIYDNSRCHMRLILVTSAMTSNKPAHEGYILSFSWDNSGVYDSQIFISNGPAAKAPEMQYRSTKGNDITQWTPWKRILIETVLYDNSKGTNGTVTLSETAANFSYIEIYTLSTSDSGTGYAQNCTKVYNPNGKSAWLTTGYSGTDGVNIKVCSALISGTQITRPYGYWEFNDGGKNSTNYIGITKVVGYR